MIRVLVMIAVTGFLVSVVTLSTAVAIGGPDVLADTAWSHFGNRWGHWDDFDRDWGDRHHRYRHGHWDRDAGPQATREIAWTGGDTLEVDMPADITYTQAPGPGKVTISGPQSVLDDIELNGGRLEAPGSHRRWGNVTIAVTAPAVRRFEMNGSGNLAIAGFNQDKLVLELSGSTDVKVAGEARSVELSMSGSGQTDLSGLKVTDADVDITGSGEATLAPTGSARLDISGSGDVTLLSHPSKLESNVTGSGRVHQSDSETPSPSPSPSPSPTPSPKRGRT